MAQHDALFVCLLRFFIGYTPLARDPLPVPQTEVWPWHRPPPPRHVGSTRYSEI